MSKIEKARKVAEHMHKVNNNVNVGRMTQVLIDNMWEHELDCILKNYERR